MDYHALHGNDVASFDISQTHRLPTVAASQVLDELQDDDTGYIPTGIDALDKQLLFDTSLSLTGGSERSGGIQRGAVTEIWGPPGSGRTALGIQLASETICSGNSVVWIDCFQKVQIPRIKAVLEASISKRGLKTDNEAEETLLGNLTHYSCLTLPHFLALISRPTPKAIAPNTSLVVVNSISALVNSALPRSHENRSSAKGGQGPTTSAKRLQGLQSIISSLKKLAATRNCAVVILSQCATRMHSEQGAALVPAINATVWEQGIATRLALFRNWTWHNARPSSVFLAGVQKLNGRIADDVIDQAVAFTVEPTGVKGAEYEASHPQEIAAAAQQKRKLEHTELEVPDSEDEDYGWAEEDEAALPAPPQQWQGSEDVILGQEIGQSDEESDGVAQQGDDELEDRLASADYDYDYGHEEELGTHDGGE
ncbi:hypothetical protein K4F52_003738 [Lecanicillium sp. MT-2017a]|nr:hypothetical protein K4F52_003738 [Lecanicillium sp. MT-2017a]